MVAPDKGPSGGQQVAGPHRIVQAAERGGATIEALRRTEVAAIPRLLAGRGQPVGRTAGHRPGVVILGTELQSQRMRLLQVVAHELVEIGQLGVGVEPPGESLVQARSRLLRQHLVGGVPQEHMMEAEGLLAGDVGRVGPDQVTAQQLLDTTRDLSPLRLGRQLTQRSEIEGETDDGCATQEQTVGVVEAIEARRQKRLDRRRDRDLVHIPARHPSPVLATQQTVVHEHRQRLFHEERVASGGVLDPAAERVVEFPARQEVLHQVLDLVGGERLQGDRRRVELAAAPPGARSRADRGAPCRSPGSARRGSSP